MKPAELPDLSRAREAAERLLTDVVWRSPVAGTCRCPGAHKHSNGTADATVFVDSGWPLVYCFHYTCKEDVRAVNGELRREAPEGVRQERKWTKAEKREWQHCQRIEYAARKDYLPKLLAQPPMAADDWLKLSPARIPAEPLAQWRLFLRSLFEPDDLIWCGELFQSGQPEHWTNFRSAAEWQQTPYGPLGPQMSLVTFCRSMGYDIKKGTVYFEGYERVAARVAQWRYTLVECDSVDKGLFSNVQRQLAGRKEFVLRAVVSTGGKSFHGWYDSIRHRPDVKRLTALLRGLGADTQTLTHLTARAPGASRFDGDGNAVGEQRLLYLNPPTL